MKSTHAALMARREPPIAFAFGLFAGLLAMLFMRALGTADLDAGGYEIGVVIAAGAGVVTAWGMRMLRPYPRYHRLWFLVVVGVGAFVGVAIQWVLLIRAPRDHAYALSSGLSTADAVLWVLVGGPVGAAPALLAAVFLGCVERLFAQGAYDARERLFFPFATASTFLALGAAGTVGHHEQLLVMGAIALSQIALFEIVLADSARVRWLRDVFHGKDPDYEVVPLETEGEARRLPHVVAGVVPLSVIMQSGEAAGGYRAAARIPVAVTGMTLPEAIAPVRRRLFMVVTVIALTMVRVGLLVSGVI